MRRTLSLSLLATLAVSAQAQLTLPYSGTDPTATLSSFQITKSGTAGRANTLYITDASNTSDVLLVNTVGLGRAAYFSINNAANTTQALRADSNGSGIGMFGFMTGTGRAGFFRITNAANTNYALHAQTNGSGPALRAEAGTGLAGDFLGGVRVTSAGGYGVYGLATETAIGTTYGVRGESASTSGFGVHGNATAASGTTYGVWGESASPDGRGVFGWAPARSGNAMGVFGQSASTSGRGVVGLANAASGNTYGVFGLSADGRGVFGWATAASGPTFGVYGQSDSPSGYGVFGIGGNNGVRGESNTPSGRGVLGFASATSGVNYGVRGQSDSPTGYGVYFVNRLAGSGTKAFRIDHPFDPENKYLNHYCSEGPEPKNVYDGVATTDAQGKAWVQLPDYFAEINKDPRYHLTVVDDSEGPGFVQVKVAKKIRNNRFMIMTSAPNIEVSWEVKGVRNDLWVRKYGAPVEVDKEGVEKSKYQHPELYGKPKEMGMNYRPEPKNPAPRSPNPKR